MCIQYHILSGGQTNVHSVPPVKYRYIERTVVHCGTVVSHGSVVEYLQLGVLGSILSNYGLFIS